MKRFIKRMILILVVLGVAAGGVGWYMQRNGEQTVSYKTGEVTRGDLLITIERHRHGGARGSHRRGRPGGRADHVLRQGRQWQNRGLRLLRGRRDRPGPNRRLAVCRRGSRGEAQVQSAKAMHPELPGRPGTDEGQAASGRTRLAAGPEARPLRGACAGQL